MTPETQRQSRRLAYRQLLVLLGSCLGVAAALTVLYVLAPEPEGDDAVGQVIVVAVLGLACYAALTVWAAQQLSRAQHPILMGSIIVTMMATVVVFGYSWTYLGMSINDPGSFTQPLSKTSAVYFTVTVLATVGFGDITATTDTTRLIVTSQMLLGLTLITVGIRLIAQSARTAAEVKRRVPEL